MLKALAKTEGHFLVMMTQIITLKMNRWVRTRDADDTSVPHSNAQCS